MMRVAAATLALGMGLARGGAVVVMLGTGTPNPEPERSGPAVAVIVGSHAYVVDAGPGVVRRAAQAARLGFPQLESKGLTTLFLTHLHSDHTAGMPDFLLSPAVTGRTEGLEVYGPAGVAAMVRDLMRAYRVDLDIRLRRGWEPSIPAAYAMRTHEIRKDGVALKTADVQVDAFRVKHGALRDSFGYRFTTPDGKSVVISGDTTLSENLMRYAQGCDILVHEVYSANGLKRRTPEWRRYHAAFHTSAVDLGRIAARVKPRVLVLYHSLPFGDPPDQIVTEIRENYAGPLIFASDLEVIR